VSFKARIEHHLEQFRRGDEGNAFHGLLELGDAVSALPELIAQYRAASDLRLRTFLLEVIWEQRSPAAIPLLAEALSDPDPQVWRVALDGLVTLASPASIAALRQAAERCQSGQANRDHFRQWLEEAITQAEEAISKGP